MQDARKPRSRVAIAKISVPKPSIVLADTLRESILRGEIAEGNNLPSERELVEQTGLTRGAVRQALRTLVVEGLVQTRNGRFGGSVVTIPGNEAMAAAINRFVKGRKLPLRTLQETREALEPYLARCAAGRRTADNLRELKALHAELEASTDNFREFALLNVEWHNAVAKASGNELLAAVLYSVSHGIHVATLVEEYDTKETRAQVLRIHAKVNGAIEAGNADLAERSMREHILATHARPLASAGAGVPLFEQPPRVRARPAATRPQRAARSARKG